MNPNLPAKIITDISILAEKYSVSKVILFGSRARGTNRSTSDIDIAVSGGRTREFAVNIDDELDSLQMIDVVILDEPITQELRNEIERDGIVIYEKI